MPLIKSERLKSDTIKPAEFEGLLAKLPRGQEAIRGRYETKIDGEPVIQEFNIPITMFRALLIFAWLYGRRIQELLLLKRKDVRWDDRYFVIEVFGLKRKDALKIKRPKPIPISNKYLAELIEYVSSINSADAYLFPGDTKGSRLRKVVSRNKDGSIKKRKDGTEMIYEYKSYLKGTMSSERAWHCLKFLAPDLWLHFFRHTVNTFIADKTGDPFLMRDWNDWSSIAPAENYVASSEVRARKVGDLRGFE